MNTPTSTWESNKLSVACTYRMEGVHCESGFLHNADGSLVYIDRSCITCPACDGKSRVPTEAGKELIVFVETFLRPMLHEMVEEAIEERL